MPFLVLLVLLGTARTPYAAEPGEADAGRRLVRSKLTPEETCSLAFLEHIGWRVTTGAPGSGIDVIGGRPGERESIEAAQRAGDLRIVVAPDTPAATLRALAVRLGALANTLHSRLAFQHRVAGAVARATRKLDANIQEGNLTFPKLLVFDSPWFRMIPPTPEWSRGDDYCVAVASPAEAVRAFYTDRAVYECYVGQWVALYAKWYEVFGDDAFNEAFRPEELMLGRPLDMRTTPLGRFLGDELSPRWRAMVIGPKDYGVDPGLAMARMGPVAFAGATGVTENVEDGLTTNDNMMIVSVSPAACRTLRENGGLDYVRRENERIWRIHAEGKRGIIRGSSGIEARDAVTAILDQPVYSEIMLFVHPYGIVPLARMVKERLGTTHRPVKVRIYRNGVDDAFYQRYRAWFQRRCLTGNDVVEVPTTMSTGQEIRTPPPGSSGPCPEER